MTNAGAMLHDIKRLANYLTIINHNEIFSRHKVIVNLKIKLIMNAYLYTNACSITIFFKKKVLNAATCCSLAN